MIFCTVLMIQYNPDKKKLFRTLRSIICQKNVTIQLVVGDDGSVEDYFEDTEEFLKSSGIQDYHLCKNEYNKGTVANVWNAVQYAKYDYLSFLSPGDYYYDEDTLADILHIMKEDDLKFAFGRPAAYKTDHGKLKMINVSIPFYTVPYRQCSTEEQYTTIRRNLIVYRDYIAGVSYYWDRKIFLSYLERIVGKVIYMEDVITSFVLLDEVNMAFLDRFVAWYEYGEGVSTSHNKKWIKRLNADQDVFFRILKKYYPKSKIVQRACKLQSIENIGGIRAKLLKAILFPDRFFYLLIHYVLFREDNGVAQIDTSFFESLCKEDDLS